MSKLKLKQILSNLHYNAGSDQLILSGSGVVSSNWEEANINWEDVALNWDGTKSVPDFVIYGSTYVTSSDYQTGSITIQGADTFGDSGSFYSIDLGEF
jgi:hypothetical protein